PPSLSPLSLHDALPIWRAAIVERTSPSTSDGRARTLLGSEPGAEGATTPRNLSGTRTVGARQLWSYATEGESGRSRLAPETRNERIPAMPDQLAAEDPALDVFADRHIGPRAGEQTAMLAALNYASLDELVDAAVPAMIRETNPLALPEPLSETEALAKLRELAGRNQV